MAKVQIKSEKLTPFGGFFPIMEPSPHTLSSAHPSRILFLQLNQFPYCFHIQKREREDETRKKAGEIIRSVRNSQKAPGCDRIYTAGEKEWDIWQQRKNSGVPINESVQKEMTEVRDELGLTQYKFPWE